MTPTYPKDAICICGHTNYYHPKSKDKKLDKFPCTWCNEQWKFCKCKDFKLAQLNEKGETIMDGDKVVKVKKAKKAKKEKAVKKEKVSGRKPTLAPFIASKFDGPFKIYANYKEKDYEATVLTSGMIRMNETDYPTPTAACSAVIESIGKKTLTRFDGWKFWKLNDDGKRVELNTLRGEKSPLAIVKEKEKKPRKAKAAKAIAKAVAA